MGKTVLKEFRNGYFIVAELAFRPVIGFELSAQANMPVSIKLGLLFIELYFAIWKR